MGPVALIFGGAAIGDQFATLESVDELLARLESLGICRIDTAGKYPPCAPGLSEELLGRARAVERGFTIDTKINCEAHGKGSLTADAIERSLMNSLSRLRVEKVCYLSFKLFFFDLIESFTLIKM
jgi:aflatoxin B1 aldehyde reductase